MEKLNFGVYKILKVDKIDFYDCFLLGNEKDTFYYQIQITSDDYIIKEGFDRLKQNLIHQQYYSFYDGNVTGLNGVQYTLTWGEKLEILDVEIGKTSKYDFGVVFKLKGSSGELLMSLKLDDDWFKFGGDPEGSIKFNVKSPTDILGKSIKIVNDKLFDIYSNSIFKTDIQSGTLKVGMSKDEIQLILGRPYRTDSMNGYDDVWVCFTTSTTFFKILFKGNKSVKIL